VTQPVGRLENEFPSTLNAATGSGSVETSQLSTADAAAKFRQQGKIGRLLNPC